MKSTRYILISFLAIVAAMFTSCDLLQGEGTVNPNVDENTFLHSPNAMQTWVNGTEKNFALTVGSYCQLMEILSDNYHNNYSRSSNTFDIPLLLNTDSDIEDLQRYAGQLRESANYAFNTVAKYDKTFTDVQKCKMHYIKGYSFILAGEHFTGLPTENGGEVKSWQENLKLALACLDSALKYAPDADEKAFIHTLLARTHYRMGSKEQATHHALTSLKIKGDMLKQVHFDGNNNVSNIAQEAIWGNWFQPLPRLDFLDPKYFMTVVNEQCPIVIAKAEENYLILAEASLADGALADAKKLLHELLEVVKKRPVKTDIDDKLDNRYNGGTKHYPNSADYVVAASPADPFRSRLVQERVKSTLVTVPYISGTSVDIDMIEACNGVDELLELVYLMRQEIFFAEGRRVADLGLRLPLCAVEAAKVSNAEPFVKALIPNFIPLNRELDEFDMDEQNKRVTIHHNMNRVIVQNKASEHVAPFFH